MSSSPINNNALPEDCLSQVFYFSEGAPKYALVCKSWCAAVKNCYQHVFRDYRKDDKIKPYTLAIQQIAPSSPISEALYEQAVKETYRAVMSRTHAPHIQSEMANLDPSKPLALVPVVKIIEDANLIQLFEALKREISNDAQPILEGDLAERSATLREWMENHQASLDGIIGFGAFRIVREPFKMDQWLSLNLTTLSPEIGKCTNLRQLDIDNNQLATLPQELFQLTRLTTLSLPNNQITTIPTQISRLTNLSAICLHGNEQLGTLPKEVGQLTRLQWLTLSHIRIHHSQERPLQVGLITDLCALDRIVEAFKEEKTEEALKMFKELPTDTKNAIYGEVHQILLPGLKNDYWRCGEDTFLQCNGQWTSNEIRIRAIYYFIYNFIDR